MNWNRGLSRVQDGAITMARAARRWGLLAAGAGLTGAGLMYLLDPIQGARRRALVRAKSAHWSKELESAARVVSHDVANRARGLVANATSLAHADAPVDDGVLVERVRARLGRTCSHPGAIEVICRDGQIMLAGRILRAEANRVLKSVQRVPGVKSVDDALERHTSPGSVPGLQGGSARWRSASSVIRRNWSPATRVFASATGLVLVGFGSMRRGRLGAGMVIGGFALVTRSFANVELPRLIGSGAAGRGAADLPQARGETSGRQQTVPPARQPLVGTSGPTQSPW